MRAIAAVLLMTIFVYGIFALVTNLIGQNANSEVCNDDNLCKYKHEASDENKDY